MPIGNYGEVEGKININPMNLAPNDLFSLGFRHNNSKRSFIFVSKVLGKHTPIRPEALVNVSEKLASLYMNKNMPRSGSDAKQKRFKCKSKTVVVGLAEASTALGQCFFDCLEGPVSYIHTTREELFELPLIFEFKEDHSHAPNHNFFLLDEKLMANAEEIIIVDDEITTGKTAATLIRALNKRFPGKQYGMASILDWRTKDQIANFNLLKDEGIDVRVVALLQGEIELDKIELPEDIDEKVFRVAPGPKHNNWMFHQLDFPTIPAQNAYLLMHSGRFGLSHDDSIELSERIRHAAEELSGYSAGPRTLCLGTGEFLYIPMKIAAEMGNNTVFQSITRTPNLPINDSNYDIRSAYSFPSPMYPQRTEFLYNLNNDQFDEVFLFFERSWPEEQLKALMNVIEDIGVKHCHLVVVGR